MSSKTAISFSYAVFTFQVDTARAVTVPIGVALWSPEKQWVKVRLVHQDERLKQFNATEHYPFVSLVEQKIDQWVSAGSLPYSEGPVAPFVDDWWKTVRELLVHRVRLSEPRPIDCRNPEEELEPLYESIVSSHRSPREQRARVDSEIRRCLQNVASKFESRQELAGFGGRPVKVLQSHHGPRGWLVIEGVNLASRKAEFDTDAMVSRLLRLREGLQEQPNTIVGYLASPDGLNGESILVEWIRAQTNAQVFDLMTQRDHLREEAEALLAKVDGELF